MSDMGDVCDSQHDIDIKCYRGYEIGGKTVMFRNRD